MSSDLKINISQLVSFTFAATNADFMKIKLSFTFSLILSHLFSHGQVSVPGSFFQSIDIFNDSTTLAFHSSINNGEQKAFTLINPRARVSLNTSYPRGLNDGPVWKGKGLTSELHFGVNGKLGALSYTFYPVIYHSQNLSFELAPQANTTTSPYGYKFTGGLGGGIDWVQRYGGSSFAAFHPGQSEVKLELGKFVTSISTQNYSVGPSVFNPIILSRQGGGFPHIRIGSDPLDLKIRNVELGKLEANFLAGILKESDYFDTDKENNSSYFNGLFLAYTPPFLENLTLGFNKALYKEITRFSAQDLISVIEVLDTATFNGQFDQIASATMDWTFPSEGFRAYVEFALNDYGSFKNGLELEHSRAYTLGFEKHSKLKNNDQLDITYEHTNLSRNHTYMWRPAPPYYIHGTNHKGYTNRGQMIGAGIGPGSNSDMLQIKYLHGKSIIGISAQRIEYNKDYFVVNIKERPRHNTELSLGSFYQIDLNKFIWSLELIISRERNRYYVEVNDPVNCYASVQAVYKLK